MPNHKNKKSAKKTAEEMRQLGLSTQFSSTKQPSAELKKKGRKRRQHAQMMMDKLLDLQDMTLEEIEELMIDSQNGKKMKAGDMMLVKYIEHCLKDGKMLVDWINRNVPYAPAKTELSGNDGEKLTITVVNYKDKE